MAWIQQLWAFIVGDATWGGILFIFFAKVAEVTVGSIRSILMTKGYRKPAVLLSLIEIFLWVFVASQVITGVAASPLKGITYCFGFSAGIYLGSVLEAKIAFGKVLIQVITTADKGPQMAASLRAIGCGVTTVDAQGKTEARKILMIYYKRRGSRDIIQEIQKFDPNAMIVENEIGGLIGGHISPFKAIVK